MLRNTAMPTILRGGQQLNVIPDFAEAGIDGRVLPGVSREAFLAELRALLGPEYDDLEIVWAANLGVPLEVDFNSPLTDVIREVMAEAAPGAPLLPILLTGGTDAQGEVTVRLKEDDRVALGRGSDPDIITASAYAYVNGLNRLEYLKMNPSPDAGGL